MHVNRLRDECEWVHALIERGVGAPVRGSAQGVVVAVRISHEL